MKSYQKGKRTKKPYGQSLPHVGHVKYEEVKAKQTLFNPVLQTFKEKGDLAKVEKANELNRVKSLMNHIVNFVVTIQNNIQKYEKDYDIVNLHTSNGTTDYTP